MENELHDQHVMRRAEAILGYLLAIHKEEILESFQNYVVFGDYNG